MNVPGSESHYAVYAHNKDLIKGWEWLCRYLPSAARKSYDILRTAPQTTIPRRYYMLKHKNFQGKWCHEVGAGERIYFGIYEDQRKVVVYYAGRHPNQVPMPPDPEFSVTELPSPHSSKE